MSLDRQLMLFQSFLEIQLNMNIPLYLMILIKGISIDKIFERSCDKLPAIPVRIVIFCI